MRKASPSPLAPLPMPPALPGWIAATSGEGLDAAAFRSGAALSHLSMVEAGAALPLTLWRDRLALAAAENGVRLIGRREGQAALRDALHLTRPGDDPGPAAQVLRQWSRAAAAPLSPGNLSRALDGLADDRIALCLNATGSTPLDRAAQVIEAILTDSPRAEVTALILADAVLAKSMGKTHLVPLLGLTMRPRDLARRGPDLQLACHRCAAEAVRHAVPLGADLARAAARLREVAPKLRAKPAQQAVDLFLSRDALAPSALRFMSDRAARRLCDRLVDLGAVRELTGRDTFRLYGL